MPTVCGVRAREIFDSRGNPTVEVDVLTECALFRAAVPSGASTGVYEALELRDGDKNRLLGKGVLKAVANINNVIGPKLLGKDVTDQLGVDKLMVEQLDGSKNEWGWCKSKLGANAILAVSMAVCRAGAEASDLELFEYVARLSGKSETKFVMPVPSFNVINGGTHAGNRLACQEFMILPVGASSFQEAMKIGAEVYHTLKGVIKKRYGQDACNVGDEGGFAPSVQDNNEALDVLMEAIRLSGHESKVKIGTDVAASEFYDATSKTYDLDFKNPNGSAADMKLNSKAMAIYYQNWIKKYPLVSIEDPFDQDDWEAYSHFTSNMGTVTQIVGDDLLVTNPTRVKKALDSKACNALLLKVNQIGSVTEAIEATTMAQAAGWGVMVSHRSGETEDTFIADLAVGLCAGEIKTGAPCRSERLAKYNQLLRIEEMLGMNAVYAGQHFRKPYLAADLPVPTCSQPLVIFVLGGPGCGKGTFCARLVKQYGFKHLSAGDLIREERARSGSEVAALIEEKISAGKLIPSEITVGLLGDEMRRCGWGNCYLIDGFPRSIENYEKWQWLLGGRVNVKFAFIIECSMKVMEQRLLNRGKTSGRSDDNIETIRKRFVTFQNETLPVQEILESRGLVRKVSSDPGIDAVWHEVEAIFSPS